jgi:lysophospholipase L1-like esterase
VNLNSGKNPRTAYSCLNKTSSSDPRRSVSGRLNYLLVVAVGLILFGVMPVGRVKAQNLLQNGNFNSPTTGGTTNDGTIYGLPPTNWTTWTYWLTSSSDAWANRAIDTNSFDGSYYMQVGSDEGITSGAGLYQIVPGLPGYAYTLTVESGVQAWWWPEGEMRIFFLDSSTNILSESVSDITTAITASAQGLPWENYTLTAVSPPGTAYVKVEFASESYSEDYGVEYAGTVWFDNAVLTSAPSAATYIPPVRIMPLGDSITWGQTAPVSTPGGYRLPLYQLLTADGFNVEMVGTVWANGALNLPQENHEGWQGYRIDQIASGFLTWVNAVPTPDVILLLIGTNDYGQNYDTATATNRLDQLIGLIATNLPNTKLVVSSVLLRTDSATVNNEIQTTFNPYIPGIVAAHAALGQQVYFIDLNSVIGAADLGTDGLHPNQTGYNIMGTNWYNTVINLISPLGTTNPPAILSVAGNSDLTNVNVTFTKPVSSSAANPANYSLSGGLTISSATLDPAAQRNVTLVTSPQVSGKLYTLTVNNVQDITSNQLTIAPGTTAQFVSISSNLTVISGEAQLIDVQFNADEFNLIYDAGAGSPNPLPVMTGAAVIGSAGDTWNQVNSSVLAYTAPPNEAYTVNPVPLNFVSGAASGVSLTLSTPGSTYNANSTAWGNYSPFTAAGSPYSALMQSLVSDYAGDASGTVTLTNLTPEQAYNLYVYTAGDTNAGPAGRTGTITVGSTAQNYTWNGTATNLTSGVDYLEFSGVTSAGGTLTLSFGNSTAETDLDGFQLQLFVVPVQLTITPSGNNVILSWPASANGTLEFATNLVPSTVWNTNLPAPVVISGQNVETNAISNAQMFFRLLQ